VKPDYVEPSTLEEALALLVQNTKETVIIAGGTDVMVRIRNGELRPRMLLSISRLEEIHSAQVSPKGGLWIGALTTFSTLLSSPIVRRRYPILADMAATMGTPQVRNLASVGGNICNASPSADSAPAFMCLNGVAHIRDVNGERIVPLSGFFTGPGSTVLESWELLSAIEVPPLPEGSVATYAKVGRNHGGDLAVVGLAIVGYPTAENPSRHAFRIALGAVAPTPIRAFTSEAILAESVEDQAVEEACEAAVAAISPIDDIRASASYRTMVVRNLMRRGIRSVMERMT
jgi:carbon-monoxide dehydrogenase medium subunit